MQQLHTDLWVSAAPLRFMGVEMGSRMTVVRLSDGTLLLHSPIAPTDTLLEEVKALGDVAVLIAPNRFHHLHVDKWQKVFPEAQTFIAPGLDTKRPDLAHTGILTNTPEAAWRDTVDQVALAGIPTLGEVVFFHRPSATLIAADFAFNVGPEAPAMTRLFFRMAGAYDKVAPTFAERLLARDRPAFRGSLEQIMDWPFDRVIVGHGKVSESGVKPELRQNYAWAMGGAG